MPTKKPMTTITIDDDIYEKIEDFRYNNRFANRSQAIMFIIRAGMKALAAEYPELDPAVKMETGKKSRMDVVDNAEERAHL